MRTAGAINQNLKFWLSDSRLEVARGPTGTAIIVLYCKRCLIFRCILFHYSVRVVAKWQSRNNVIFIFVCEKYQGTSNS